MNSREAMKRIVEILYPNGDAGHEWSANELELIAATVSEWAMDEEDEYFDEVIHRSEMQIQLTQEETLAMIRGLATSGPAALNVQSWISPSGVLSAGVWVNGTNLARPHLETMYVRVGGSDVRV